MMYIKLTRLLFSLFLLLAGLHSFAQSGQIPPFQIIQANGKVFTARELPAGKPILIVYFSPECDHCHTFMQELFKKPADIQKASVVLITFLSVEKVRKFVADYKMAQYPNVYTGTEGTSFFVRNHYKIREMPFTALYDKQGKLLCSYEKEIPFNQLMARLK